MRDRPISMEEIRIPGAPERMPLVFDALDTLIDLGLAAGQEIRPPEAPIEHVRLRMFDRGFNCLKGTKTLLEGDHWELGAAVCRQLFEMVVNLEEIEKSNDPDDAAFAFVRFGAFQLLNLHIAEIEDFLASGRVSDVASARLGELRAMRDQSFSDLGRVGSDGVFKPQYSWSGKSVWKLAQGSDHQIRSRQYQVLFASLSAQSHAAPGALFADPLAFGQADALRQSLAYNDRQLVEIAAVSTSLFVDLWRLGTPTLPPVPASSLAEPLGVLTRELTSRMGFSDDSHS